MARTRDVKPADQRCLQELPKVWGYKVGMRYQSNVQEPESGGQEYHCELLLWLPQCRSCGWKNCLQSLRQRKFAAANRSRLSDTEVDDSHEGTRGQGHFLVQRGKPAKRELCKGVHFPDQYGCGNLDGTDLFSTLLFEHTVQGSKLATNWSHMRLDFWLCA